MSACVVISAGSYEAVGESVLGLLALGPASRFEFVRVAQKIEGSKLSPLHPTNTF